MTLAISAFLLFLLHLSGSQTTAVPTQELLSAHPKQRQSKFFDIQAHRGGRGNTVESTLPSFAWGLIDGATTLELDNGITKVVSNGIVFRHQPNVRGVIQDGVVVVWHDENIVAAKCQDTEPAFENDPEYPYVGRYIANLTLAQLKTLDCGSKRQEKYPMQLTYPGVRISTLQEVFDFAACADPSHQILWNIESKINARETNRTLGVSDFVHKQHEIFIGSHYRHAITYQSFDWRTLVAMKELDATVITSALIDDETAYMGDNETSPWLAGLRLDDFEGATAGEQIARAARSIGADILSPGAHPEVLFTTREMVAEAHRLAMAVKPWTVNRLDTVEELMSWGVDGIITDYPNVVRRWAKGEGYMVAPKYPKQRVLGCLGRAMDGAKGPTRIRTGVTGI